MLSIVLNILLPLIISIQSPAFDADFKAKAAAIVEQMTLVEKVGQMVHQAHAIPRLGIPAYDWWNEALHGVAKPGNVSVFPEPIGLAATFDDRLVHQMAVAISDEARARYNLERKKSQGWNQGLDFWAPNINIFRDPRWGRGQETYGEDPFLTSRMGVAYVTGMQGNDPRFLKTISTPKHYAVHSGPDPLRHVFNAKPSTRDEFLTYLPAFEACVREGGAWSVMSSYNSVNGYPMSANPFLLQKILRVRWGFKGYVVSDCGAIDDIVYGHHFATTKESASALAVQAGCDLNCGDTYESLVSAATQGEISESTINVSVARLMEARLRMGMFGQKTPWDSIGMDVVDSSAHRRLALQAARESIVLLKNDGVLPLRRSIAKVAVIGPNADDPNVILGNYNGHNNGIVTPLEGIRRAIGASHVTYVRGSGLTGLSDPAPIPVTALDMTGQYFQNPNLTGAPAMRRHDRQVNFDWGDGPPAKNFPQSNFSVRWTGQLVAPKTGEYLLGITCDDGMRLRIDGKTVLEDWKDGPARTTTARVSLVAGQPYRLEAEYYQRAGEAVAKLSWAMPRSEPFSDAVEAARRADAVVLVLGISGELENEEHDRTELDLPKVQQDLMKAVSAVGKPTVLVLVNGSPISSVWAQKHVPGIVEAWYPGEQGGNAIADVLFGAYNPSGKLPMTVWRGLEQLPDFQDYNMHGHTYRYARAAPLYQFGFGLSYTTFAYDNLRLPKTIKTDEPLSAEVDVTNTGSTAGDEVVELYIKQPNASQEMPPIALKGFKRVHLDPGQKKTVSFAIRPKAVAVWHDDMHFYSEPQRIEVSIGGSQPSAATRSAIVEVEGKVVRLPD